MVKLAVKRVRFRVRRVDPVHIKNVELVLTGPRKDDMLESGMVIRSSSKQRDTFTGKDSKTSAPSVLGLRTRSPKAVPTSGFSHAFFRNREGSVQSGLLQDQDICRGVEGPF